MRKLFLIAVLILISVDSFAIFGFGKKKTEKPQEIEAVIIKRCYYQMEVRDNVYGIFMTFQEDCSGINLVGVVTGRRIIEYDEDIVQINEQTPANDETFREKVGDLWPNLQEINFKPSE